MKRLVTICFILILFSFLTDCAREDKSSISASGVLESTQIRVSSKIGGRIKRMYFDEGMKVKKGEVLYEMECKELHLQLMQAETNLKIAKSQYALILKGARKEDIEQIRYSTDILEANLQIAKNDYERAKRLFEANAISQKGLEEAELRVKVIEKQIEASRQNYQKIKNISRAEEIEIARLKVESSEIGVAILKEQIKECRVEAPSDGIIAKKVFNEGELLSPGSVVYLINNSEKIFLKVYLTEKEIFRIKLGDKVIIRTDSGIQDREGIVVFISDTAEFTPKTIWTKDERTRLVFMVKIEIPNNDLLLKHGLPADAYFMPLSR